MQELHQTTCSCPSGDLYTLTHSETYQSNKNACEGCAGRGWYFSPLALECWNKTKVCGVDPEPLSRELRGVVAEHNQMLEEQRRLKQEKKLELQARKVELMAKELDIKERELELSVKTRVITIKRDPDWQERVKHYL